MNPKFTIDVVKLNIMAKILFIAGLGVWDIFSDA
jgi:hypothetical protein